MWVVCQIKVGVVSCEKGSTACTFKLQPDPQFQYFLPKIDDQAGMIVIM